MIINYRGGVSEIPLQNGWTNLNSSYYGNLTATKILDKVVVLQGMISGDVSDNGTVVANIPAGFRPSKNLYVFAMIGTSSFTRILINVNGNISIASNDAPAQLHINNIVFAI